jgi:Chalcone isomerase-like
MMLPLNTIPALPRFQNLLCGTLVLLASLVVNGPVHAKESLDSYVKGLQLQGQGRMTFWGFDVYDARLYVGDQRGQTGFALDLNYLRSLKGSDISKRTIDEMQRLGVSETNRSVWGKKLDGIFPDVVSGSSLTAIHIPGRGTVFLHNGKPAGEIAGDDFAKAFFSIWLDPKTAAPKLRTALIGQACAPLIIAPTCEAPR